MNPALIPILGSAVKKLIDRAIPDKDKALEIKRQLDLDIQDIERTELKGAIDIIVAEAKGDSWLQRSWRPLLMLWFAGLVGAHWLGFTPENMPQETVNHLLTIVQYGVSGYIASRGVEKAVKEWKKSP